MSTEYDELKRWLEETKDTPLETMGGFFDVRIGDYEEHMAKWDKHYQWMAEYVPMESQTLLDIGCGSGLELDCIFKRFPNLDVTGVDISVEMLNKLKEKHRDKSLHLILENYFVYEPGENCYDVVVSFETLHHYSAEKKTELFQKLYKCLKPGGIYLECDYIANTQEIEDMVFEECARRRCRDHIAPDDFIHFDTPLTLTHELKAIHDGGFDIVEVIGFLPEDDHTPLIRAIKNG